MTITLALEPQQEARLAAAAEAKGISASAYLQEAIDPLLSKPSTAVGIAELVPGSIAEMFLENMSDLPLEDYERLPKDGASEHDHYLYGAPKRHS
jgi:hypothetical protein